MHGFRSSWNKKIQSWHPTSLSFPVIGERKFLIHSSIGTFSKDHLSRNIDKLAWYMLVILVPRRQQVEQMESQNHKETDCPPELQKKKETVVSLFNSQCMTFFHTAPPCIVSQEGTTSSQSNKPVTGCLARDRAIDTLTNSDTSSSPANSFI